MGLVVDSAEGPQALLLRNLAELAVSVAAREVVVPEAAVGNSLMRLVVGLPQKPHVLLVRNLVEQFREIPHNCEWAYPQRKVGFVEGRLDRRIGHLHDPGTDRTYWNILRV